MATKTPSSKSSTHKTVIAGRPSARIKSDVIQHSLKPTSPGPKPTVKPGPGPKTK